MMLFFILSLTVFLGARCESESACDTYPECLSHGPFPHEAYREHQETGDLLPSNEFFEKSCDQIVENVKCARDYHKLCSDFSIDLDSMVDTVAEFCDPESDLRKGYVAHVGCLNRINFTSACMNSIKLVEHFPEEIRDTLAVKNIEVECLVMHILKPCIVEIAEKSCGEEAGQTASNFIERGKDVFFCSEDDADFFEKLLVNLTLDIVSLVF